MWLGNSTKKSKRGSSKKTLGIVLLVAGLISLASSVAGMFLGTTGGRPYVNRVLPVSVHNMIFRRIPSGMASRARQVA